MLTAGQIVEVAALLTSRFSLHSKHSTTKLRRRFQKPWNFSTIEGSSTADVSSLGRGFRSAFGANGGKPWPHWWHIELLAAA